MILADLFETANLPLSAKQLPRVRGSYGAFIITMTPENFLALTTTNAEELKQITSRPFPYDKAKYTDYLGREEGFGKYELPFLKVRFPSGQIFGHEGRHRSAMVQRAGGTKIPVVIYPYEEDSYEAQISYYPEGSDDRINRSWGPFPTKTEAQTVLDAEQEKLEAVDAYIDRARVEYLHGLTLKGQPDRSDGWDKAAWRVEDFPHQLLGQFNQSVRVTDYRVGLVKGYRHFRR